MNREQIRSSWDDDESLGGQGDATTEAVWRDRGQIIADQQARIAELEAEVESARRALERSRRLHVEAAMEVERLRSYPRAHLPLPVRDEAGQEVEVICADCSDEISEHWDNGDGTVVIGVGVRWSSCPHFTNWAVKAAGELLDGWDSIPMAPGSNKYQMRDQLRSVVTGASFWPASAAPAVSDGEGATSEAGLARLTGPGAQFVNYLTTTAVSPVAVPSATDETTPVIRAHVEYRDGSRSETERWVPAGNGSGEFIPLDGDCICHQMPESEDANGDRMVVDL